MDDAKPRRVRKLGVTLFCLAVLLTMLGAFHLIENWRGKHRWEAYKRQLVSQGVQLDLASFIPRPIPPEQNFAATPFFDELLPGPKPTNWNRWPDLIRRLPPQLSAGRNNERHLTDFPAWQAALRAEKGQDTNTVGVGREDAAKELLAAMSIYEPALQELRSVSARPLSRYNIRYDLNNPWGIFLPHLPVIKSVCQGLSLKACAELAAGRSDDAMEDVRLIVRITKSTDAELFLITHMVRLACFHLIVQPVWEGLALDRWSTAQLEELQGIMLGFNFIKGIQAPEAAEQAAGIITVDILLKERDKAGLLNAFVGPESGMQLPNVPKAALNAMALLVPRGWYYMEQFNYVRTFQELAVPGTDATNRVIFPEIVNANEAKLDRMLSRRNALLGHYFFSRLLMPAMGKAQRKTAQAQTAAHQAAIACALERYHHKTGDYPKELAALAPEFMGAMPHDVINGKPMHYKPKKRPVIYSVGWDETDNNGTPGKTLWDDKGDWVWTYPK